MRATIRIKNSFIQEALSMQNFSGIKIIYLCITILFQIAKELLEKR